ncbi:MAG: hypothetical protein V4591_04300 [Bdellovibrionota bacterium]
MWHKFRIHFNSSALTAFFIMTALGFTILLFAIWSISVRAERVANLQHDESLIMNGITGSILGSAELDSQGLQLQSQMLMQEYLNYTIENSKSNTASSNIVRVGVYFLNPESSTQAKQVIAEWASETPVSKECIERRTEYFQPSRSLYTYLIDLSLNTCSEANLSLLEYHTLSTPIVVALAVILIWGVCIYAMLRSVSFAGGLLGSSDNTSELLDNTAKIKWTDVGILAQRALQVRGKNLQYYQTLVLDAQHDIAKVLDFINRKYDDKDLNHGISIIRGIIQRLATEVRSTDTVYHDVTAHREIDAEELLRLVKIYYAGDIIENELPSNFCLNVSDISLFERLLVNLSSNAVKHSTETPRVRIFFEKNTFKLRVYTPISDYSALKLHFAKLTHRIDVKNTENPVYIKFFGRTGRGLSIVKRGVLKLGGRLIFDVNKKIVETGIDLPACLVQNNTEQIAALQQIKRRVISFKNEEFIQIALSHGLKDFIVSEIDLQQLISQGINLEIVSDYEITESSNSTVRILAKKERIEGIALNWLDRLK